jgi:hypothetical protein
MGTQTTIRHTPQEKICLNKATGQPPLPPSSFLLPPSSFLLPPSSFLLPPSSFLLPPSPYSNFRSFPIIPTSV